MHYDVLGGPIFREREMPRTLELAVARADGRGGETEEMRAYAARSARRQARACVTCLLKLSARWVLPIVNPN